MSLLESYLIDCPYCGEQIEILIDCSAGDQDCIEDCQVCCKPISLKVRIDDAGAPSVTVRGEDDG
jgi:hypothetical protein